MKSNIKEIWDFINGKTINTNNYNFYIDAINITDDKYLYYKCPKKVKQNYMFVLYIIEKFKNNIDFINEVAQNYLSEISKSDYTYQELTFIMSDLIDDNKYSNYSKEKNMIYNSKRKLIEEYLNKEQNEEEYGLGFIIVQENEKSEVITNYFAQKFISEIFNNMENLNLESIIHMNFKEKSELINYGIERFIIEYIDLFDEELSYYIEDNIELIYEIKNIINTIIKNWDNYIIKKYEKKFKKFQNFSQIIINKHHPSLSIDEIYNYIDNNNSPLPINLSHYKKIINKKNNNNNINIKDYKCIKEITKLAIDIFVYDKQVNINNIYNSKPQKTKILKFKPKDN